VGEGTPCQPRSYRAGEQRFAFERGVSVYPKRLATGLDVRLMTEVSGISLAGGEIAITTVDGKRFVSPTMVLTMPAPQVRSFLAPLRAAAPELSAPLALLRQMSTVCSLTTIAGFDAGQPPWDVLYPEDTRILQLVSHDSAKRGSSDPLVLVAQALPAWSRAHAEDSPAVISRAMLEELSRLAGEWARNPAWVQTHRWMHARPAGGSLSGPMLIELPGGARIGLAGDAFSVAGGVQGAWASGRALARRLEPGRLDE
jgi:predicted NAD/FAD-dependent oxidoreductase